MKIDEFSKKLKAEILSYLPDEYVGSEVELTQVEKDKGKKPVLIVRMHNENVASAVCLESFYDEILHCTPFEDVAKDIASAIRSNSPLKHLRKQKALFPALHEEDIEVKVGKVFENSDDGKKYAELILYKNNIVDSMMLDAVFGPLGWKKENVVNFRNDGSEKMTCIISAKDNDGNWISKDGVGTESDFESEKGQETDAMKRAGFNWGIGRELKYKMPKLFVSDDKCNISTVKDLVTKEDILICRDHFSVEQIVYMDEDCIDRRITYIAIRNETKGCIAMVWDARNKTVEKTQKAQAIREEKSVNTGNKDIKVPTTNKNAVCRPTFTAIPTATEESSTATVSSEVTTTETSVETTPSEPTVEETTPVERTSVESETAVEEKVEEVANSTELPWVEVESSEPNPSIEAPAEETPETFDIADPYMEPCDVAKFKREGKLLGELKPSEIRWVFQRPDASARLKEACRMIAKDKAEVKAEFISHGINP